MGKWRKETKQAWPLVHTAVGSISSPNPNKMSTWLLVQRAGELQSQAAPPPAGASMRDPVDPRSLVETIHWESRCFKASHEASTLVASKLCCCTWILPGYVYTIISTDHRPFFDAKTKGRDTHHTYTAKQSSTWNRYGHVQCSCAMAAPESRLGIAGTGQVVTSQKYARKDC